MPEPGPALRPDIVFLDVESTGLHPGSYPIEVGICDDGLRPASWLVRPDAGWARLAWDPVAEALHGITPAMLAREGREAVEVADALNARLAGRLVVSDAPGWDRAWLERLFEAAGQPMLFRLRDEGEAFVAALAPGLVPGTAEEILARFRAADVACERLYPRPHRAGPDALSAAARFRMILDPAFLEACLSLGDGHVVL